MAYTVVSKHNCDRLTKAIAAEAIDTGELVYLASGGWTLALATVATAKPAMGVVTRGVTAAEIAAGVLPEVCSRAVITGYTKTLGAPQYLEEGATGGLITETRPSTSGDVIQVVGYAVTAAIVCFNIGLANNVKGS